MSRLLTGRRSAPVVVGLFLLLALAAIGLLKGTGPVAGMDAVPDSFESSRAAALVAEADADGRDQLLVVLSRADGGELTAEDAADVETLRAALAEQTGAEALGPMPSEDGKADLLVASIPSDASTDTADDRVEALRALAGSTVPESLRVEITGGPAVAADVRGAFAGADLTLLAVTIAVVAVLLLLTYRSPVLWILPLAVVGLAERVTMGLLDVLGERASLAFDAGVVSVLVFGAGANYALLLISRYREELHRHEDHREALAAAWRGTVPAILASNATVVIALLSLLLAVMPAARGIGIAAACGLVISLIAVLFPLTALLAVAGRRVFWPLVPRPSDEAPDPAPHGLFARVACGVVRRPLLSVLGSLLVLGVLATGLIGMRVGLAQDEQFATATEAQAGFDTLAAHYGNGQGSPHTVVVPVAELDAVTTAAEGSTGVVSVSPAGTTPEDSTVLSVVGTASPGSAAALTEVRELRAAVHGVAPDALVGGRSAEALDVREASFRDLAVVAPAILLVVLMVLALLVRALVAPVLLMLVNLLGAVASIGLGLGVWRALLGVEALDVTVPLLAFLFLVALGVDYTMFLVHRARHEAAGHGTAEGMVRAVGATGVVITSAGVVLAAVFAALGVLPLVVLGQLGLIVGLGVLLDTLLVRTVLVPALFALVGDRMWWPSRP
ncbi:MMPL family transporter [Brachybacterium sp. NBEC-018]|uniref:MMPL family transporter n=1 Tax=Brachybacterium sp. NBEC-018 TaxID=2996004 RepID=UPI002175281F|nr:MMPL family transporter [Brachybacterium sp. NBEC-018]UVY84397.1 MMPL family transporter [Brachybacterium sp. NBEC-018]